MTDQAFIEELSKKKEEAETKYLTAMKDLDEVRSENTTIKENEIRLTSENREFSKMKEKYSKMKEENSKMKEEISKMKRDLATADANLKTSKKQYSEVANKRHKEKLELDKLKSEDKNFEGEINRLKNENVILIAKLNKETSTASWQGQVDALQAKLKETKEKLESTAAELGKQKDIASDSAKNYRGLVVASGKSFHEKNCFEVLFSDFI